MTDERTAAECIETILAAVATLATVDPNRIQLRLLRRAAEDLEDAATETLTQS